MSPTAISQRIFQKRNQTVVKSTTLKWRNTKVNLRIKIRLSTKKDRNSVMRCSLNTILSTSLKSMKR